MKSRKFEDYNVSKDEFFKALDELELQDLAELEAIAMEAERESPYEFSKELLAKQDALICEVEKRERRSHFGFINLTMGKAAVLAVLVGIVALGLGRPGQAGKYPIVKFFQERYDDHIEIEPHQELRENEEKPQIIESVYEMGWVPEGYEKKEEKKSEFSIVQIFNNKEKGKDIVLEQYCVIMYYSIKEEENFKEVAKDGIKFYFLEGEDENTAIWYQNGYQFVVKGDVEQTEVMKIIKNIQKVK